MIRVFLGYDAEQTVAYHVASHSLLRHSSSPVSITPLMLSQLRGVFDRPRDPRQSTDFAFTRFLVPHLCDYSGWALFADSDILVSDDIAKLWDLRDDRYAVQVVRHNQHPVDPVKFLGREQSAYARKNWSSVMLFNNARCRALTPAYVSQAPGLDLHQFRWLDDDAAIGALPARWNHLVDCDVTPADPPATLHYTLGGPWFEPDRSDPHTDLWWRELEDLERPLSATRTVRALA